MRLWPSMFFALPVAVITVMIGACGGGGEDTPTGSTTTSGTVNAGNDPNFNIVAHSDASFTATNRKVDVFGIPIYAYAEVEDVKLLHAANIMAQYLDNDEDGQVDNATLLTALTTNNASLFMWKTEAQKNLDGQDLGADESIPLWHTNGHTGTFDAALEEVLHVITHTGYTNAYPSVFGEQAGTAIASAMDIARGGHFQTIPSSYPSGAWYTYTDASCNYACMITEYFYWSLTSILGAQQDRLGDISDEWNLNTSALVQSGDPAIYGVLTDSQYKVPTVLPDGTYRR